ncbi:hypothetical protein ACRZ9O_10445 [Aquirufa sp. HETE-40SA]
MSKSEMFAEQLYNELESLGFYVCSSGSDLESKRSLFKPKVKPNFSNQTELVNYLHDFEGIKQFTEKYSNVCEFSVELIGKKEYYVIWDRRVNQPYEKSKNCVRKGFFYGKYDFKNKSEFLNHIQSDYGLSD